MNPTRFERDVFNEGEKPVQVPEPLTTADMVVRHMDQQQEVRAKVRGVEYYWRLRNRG